MKRASLKKYPAGKTYYVKVWHEGLKKHYEINTHQAQKRKADVFLDKFLGDYNEWSKQKLEESNPTYLHNAVQAFIKHKRGDGQTSKGTIEGYELALNGLIECCPNPKMDVNGLGSLIKVGTRFLRLESMNGVHASICCAIAFRCSLGTLSLPLL